MADPPRILVTTDLPFWRASTGAEQRILSLVAHLRTSNTIHVFYLAEQSSLSPQDQQRVDAESLNVTLASSSRPPKNLWKRMRWQADSIAHALRSSKPNRESKVSETSMTLADFRWPWAIDAFSECVSEFKPTVVLVEYVKLAYLLEALTAKQKAETLCIVDTHDILSKRYQQFHERGLAHWLAITPEEEAAAISKFNIAIAIQSHEANWIRAMSPGVNVITCGHCSDPTIDLPAPVNLKSDDTTDSPLTLTIGCMASANAANIHSLQNFIDHCWGSVVNSVQTPLRLLIAGDVGKHLDLTRAAVNVRTTIQLMGFVDRREDFYQQVDAVVNPIEFGTGLKIKNIEALQFGKPVFTTGHGAEGMEAIPQHPSDRSTEQRHSPILIFDGAESFTELIRKLKDPTERGALQASVTRYCLQDLTPSRVYGSLMDAIREFTKLS